MLLLLAWLLAPAFVGLAGAAAPGAVVTSPWPDGCVDSAEDGVVVLEGEDGREVELRVPPGSEPAEGTCFQSGRRDLRRTATRRAEAAALVEALERGPSAGIIPLTSAPEWP